MEPTVTGGSGWEFGCPITKEHLQEVAVGDVVAFVVARPECQPNFMTKRVRALAGEVVVFQGKRMIVPSGHVWVIGDNEPVSYDSRHYGAVPLTNLRKKCYICFTTTSPFVVVLRRWPDYTYNGSKGDCK